MNSLMRVVVIQIAVLIRLEDMQFGGQEVPRVTVCNPVRMRAVHVMNLSWIHSKGIP